LCFAISQHNTCTRGDKYAFTNLLRCTNAKFRCRFSHDIDAFLGRKPADIGETCYIYDVRGFCPFGLSCRFGKAHIVDNKNIKNEEVSCQNFTKSNLIVECHAIACCCSRCRRTNQRPIKGGTGPTTQAQISIPKSRCFPQGLEAKTAEQKSTRRESHSHGKGKGTGRT